MTSLPAVLNHTEVSVMGMVATMAGYKTGDEWLSMYWK